MAVVRMRTANTKAMNTFMSESSPLAAVVTSELLCSVTFMKTNVKLLYSSIESDDIVVDSWAETVEFI